MASSPLGGGSVGEAVSVQLELFLARLYFSTHLVSEMGVTTEVPVRSSGTEGYSASDIRKHNSEISSVLQNGRASSLI